MTYYSHDDYTVGWICALPEETAAARSMLDERHSAVSDPDDSNSYFLGRIGPHNVVVVCLQSGLKGVAAAVAAATEMRCKFRGIQHWVLVGIGGGVPNKQKDIRLGDVVVAQGVLKYEYGKIGKNGEFNFTLAPDKPSPAILKAMGVLETQHRLGKTQIPTLLSDLIQRHSSSSFGFSYPGIEFDQLFASESDHLDTEETCDKCERDKLVRRPPRENNSPVIHCGLIASGNIVIKDGATRDRLSKEHGFLCFEMEAAGIIGQIACAVIRGICDYADSHKNKRWQAYAAATAAAYAKELLTVLPESKAPLRSDSMSEVSYEYSGRNGSQIFGFPIPLKNFPLYDHERAHRRLSQKRLANTTKRFTQSPEFQAWLNREDYACIWCTGNSKQVPGSRGPVDMRRLMLSSTVGSGKTMIATAVVDIAKCLPQRDSSLCVFFYCDSNKPDELQASYILTSYIHQLYQYLAKEPWSQLGGDMMRETRQAFDFTDLKDIFIELFNLIPNVIYVLDGLDSLSVDDIKLLLQVLCSVFQQLPSSPNGSRLFLSSRKYLSGHLDIYAALPGACHVSTSYVKEDIELYIDECIREKTQERKLTDNVRLLEETKKRLLEMSSGMFLWVSLQLESLWNTCFTDADIKLALDQIPEALEDTYRRCLDRIALTNHKSLSLKVLRWLCFASRPLRIDELREAVAFNTSDDQWDPHQIPRGDLVIACCANLAVEDPISKTISLVHPPSVRQYLQRNAARFGPWPDTPEKGELECGEFCVAYLSFSDFSLPILKPGPQLKNPEEATFPIGSFLELPEHEATTSSSFSFSRLFSRCRQGRRQLSRTRTSSNLSLLALRPPPVKLIDMPIPSREQYKFLDYAITNWAFQCKHITPNSPVWLTFVQLALIFNKAWNFHPWWQPDATPHPSTPHMHHIHSLFSWAVKESHLPLLHFALNPTNSPPPPSPSIPNHHLYPLLNIPTPTGETQSLPALHFAVQQGLIDVVKLLLHFKVYPVTTQDQNGQTALHHAARGGHLGIARLLLNDYTTTTTNNNNNNNYFNYNDNDNDNYNHNNDHDNNDNADNTTKKKTHLLNLQDHTNRTALHIAASLGNDHLVTFLLNQGATIIPTTITTTTTSTIQSPSFPSITPSSPRYNFNSNSRSIPTPPPNPLITTIQTPPPKNKTKTLLALVTPATATATATAMPPPPLNSPDECGRTALHYAAQRGDREGAKILLEAGADPNLRDAHGETPLSWAAEKGFGAVVVCLLEFRADPGVRDNWGFSPLDWALKRGHEAIVQVLMGYEV